MRKAAGPTSTDLICDWDQAWRRCLRQTGAEATRALTVAMKSDYPPVCLLVKLLTYLVFAKSIHKVESKCLKERLKSIEK